MSRMIFTAVSLLLVLIISTVGVISLNNTCDELAETLDNIKICAIENETEKANELINSVIELWQKDERIISLLIDHREIDEIEETIKSLPVFARQNDTEKLEEKASVAAERVRHIKDKEKVSIENVF